MRIIDVMLKEEGRLFFCTARGKDFYKELLANSTVAVTGLNDKWQTVHTLWGVPSGLQMRNDTR